MILNLGSEGLESINHEVIEIQDLGNQKNLESIGKLWTLLI